MAKYYKYVDARGIDILRNKRLKVSQFNGTNDPFEILPRMEYPTDTVYWQKEFDRLTDSDPVFESAKQAKLKNPVEYARLRNKFIEESIARKHEVICTYPKRQRDGFSKQLAFVCLTGKPDDILMWAHYGDSFKGIVFEFDADHGFFANPADEHGNRRIVPIDYRDTRPVYMFGDPFRLELLNCKGKAWEYEKEIRMLFHRSYCISEGDNIYVRLPEECVTGVIIGTRASPDLAGDLKRLNDQQWGGRLSIRSAVEDPEEYKMSIE